MDRRIGRMATILVCVLLGGLSYFSCAGKEPVKADSGHQLVMGTFARVVVVAENQGVGKECIQAALTEIHKVDELMSDYRSESEISKVNKEAFDHAVEVSESTYEVLQRSVDCSELTAGAFDITVGPLMDLFHNAEKDDAAPTKDQIAEAKSKVGFEKLKLDRQSKTVRFAVKGMRLDLGGIAKGYAIDKAIEAARRGGATGAMIDIGGDIRCFGSPPKGREHWLIGVQDPNSATKGIGGGKLLLTLKVTNAAVATSGDYRQFVLIEGKRRSHIMDRKTGTSSEGLSSVTIITENATDADALATAVSVMGAEKGLVLIEKRPETEAILITSGPEYERTSTTNAEKYVRRESQGDNT
ncbi:MAG: FAD:protein FMN transferase [Planctomycetota bacterium]